MTSAAPPVYTRPPHPVVASVAARLIAAGIAVGCLGVLVLAAGLEPAPAGLGTHRALGLQACGYLARSGIPCPTCGMTTAFAHFARGDLPRSLYTQPLGAVLAAAAAMAVWGGAYVAATGRPAYRLLRLVPARYYLPPLLALAVLAWAWKIWVVVAARGG